MLNNDAVADQNWAAELVRAAESGPPQLGMLQSLMLFKERPDTINSTGIELSTTGSGRDRHEGMQRPVEQEQEEIFCCCAGAAMCRRSMLEQLRLSSGYFDRTHFMYYEDLDLGWRARLSGWSASYVPNSVVFHRWHGSSERHGRAWLIAIARTNRIRTLLKNASWAFLIRIGFNIIGASLDLLWFARARGPLALYRAVTTSLGTRRAVTALATEDRRRIEARWLTPR